MNKTTDNRPTCYCCGATDQPLVWTKRHGFKCRSAKACMVRWSAARIAAQTPR